MTVIFFFFFGTRIKLNSDPPLTNLLTLLLPPSL